VTYLQNQGIITFAVPQRLGELRCSAALTFSNGACGISNGICAPAKNIGDWFVLLLLNALLAKTNRGKDNNTFSWGLRSSINFKLLDTQFLAVGT
jgi:hypothetical protein